jgi:hypothetical protein
MNNNEHNQEIESVKKAQRETINALLEIAPEVLEEIHGGLRNVGGCDSCCKWEAGIA